AKRYPTLDFKGSIGSNVTGGSLFGGGSTVEDQRFVVNLKLPLYQGGLVSAKISTELSHLNAARARLSGARRQVQRQVSSAFRGIDAGSKRITALGHSVDSF